MRNTWVYVALIVVLVAGVSVVAYRQFALAEGTNVKEPTSQPTSAQAQKVVNARCPIMGTALKTDKVPEDLTRMYKGQKVGFCCGGCPSAWDKMSDAEKDKALEKAGKADEAPSK
jgi:hypothetical protein